MSDTKDELALLQEAERVMRGPARAVKRTAALAFLELPDPLDLLVESDKAMVLLGEQADEYDKASRAESTRDVYARAWANFEAWCACVAQSLPIDSKNVKQYMEDLERRGLSVPKLPLPVSPEVVRRYLTDLARRRIRPSSISVATSAIRAKHFDAGVGSPTTHPDVKRVIEGIRRTHGIHVEQKAAIEIPLLRRLVDTCGDDTAGLRDRAILLLGFASALRRGSVTELDIDDVRRADGGLRIHVKREKTDQVGQGRTIAVPRGIHEETCPVRAFFAWKEALLRLRGARLKGAKGKKATGSAWLSSDALFVRLCPKDRGARLTPQSVALIVKSRAKKAGLGPFEIEQLAGHSLRSGLVTVATKGRKRLDRIMAQTGHKKPETVLKYVRDAEMFDVENAASDIGL